LGGGRSTIFAPLIFRSFVKKPSSSPNFSIMFSPQQLEKLMKVHGLGPPGTVEENEETIKRFLDEAELDDDEDTDGLTDDELAKLVQHFHLGKWGSTEDMVERIHNFLSTIDVIHLPESYLRLLIKHFSLGDAADFSSMTGRLMDFLRLKLHEDPWHQSGSFGKWNEIHQVPITATGSPHDIPSSTATTSPAAGNLPRPAASSTHPSSGTTSPPPPSPRRRKFSDAGGKFSKGDTERSFKDCVLF
jgi:hypothetical protein